MASEGPLYPTAVQQFGTGSEADEAWVNGGNIVADDGSTASVTAATFDNNDITNRLRGLTYGFSIPADATVNGIIVEIERHASAGSAVDFRVQLVDAAAALAGDNNADTVTAWPGTAGIATYGAADDMWGTTLGPSDINDADFGVVVSVQATGNNTDVHIDYIRVTVHYTPAGGGGAVADTYYYRSTGQGAHHG